MTCQPATHGSFSIERVYDASPERVFAAWSDIEIKQRWFIGPEKWTLTRRELNFAPGGIEILHGRFPGGLETLYTARFHDIVINERIVCVYDMHLDHKHHSVSLNTVEIDPVERGTRLVYTEQTAWLDGTSSTDGKVARERGVAVHLDRLRNVLAA
jgi:uncharacterized protein YndB with AHSA1/START domain